MLLLRTLIFSSLLLCIVSSCGGGSGGGSSNNFGSTDTPTPSSNATTSASVNSQRSVSSLNSNSIASSNSQTNNNQSSGNQSSKPVLDSVRPNAPKIRFSATEPNVYISWDPATDNVGVTQYKIYRDGFQLASLDGEALELNDYDTYPSTTYEYSISAGDANNNWSPLSAITIKTPTPIIISSSSSSQSSSSVTTSSQSSSASNISSSTSSSTSSFSSSSSTNSTSSSTSSQSSSSVISSSSSQADVTPPTVPSGFSIIKRTQTELTLNWVASTDKSGVARYDVFLNGSLTGTATTTSFNFTHLTAGTSYSLSVKAIDAVGNQSTESAPFITSTDTVSVPVYRHGDAVELAGTYGTNDVTKTFLGGHSGMIENTNLNQVMANGNGWIFNNLGGTTSVINDTKRGKVLFTPEDDRHYNAVRRFDPGFAIAEQRYFYKAHWARNVMMLDGQPYTKSYQWKHERINWENTVVDGNCEIKVHSWLQGGSGVLTFVNRSASDKSTYYAGKAADPNSDWALLEIMVFTGTQGKNDGKLVTRVHKQGKTWISQNKQAERIYADPSLRLRYFIEQNYFGNFGQVEDGVDNKLPKPNLRELYSDDSRIIIGNTTNMGWKRVELRDKPALADATLRELQDWSNWNNSISVKLNTGGLPKGQHDLYLVVIDGVDSNGWDNVVDSKSIRVLVE